MQLVYSVRRKPEKERLKSMVPPHSLEKAPLDPGVSTEKPRR